MLTFALGIYFYSLLNLSYTASWRNIVVCDDIRKNTRLFGAMSTMFFLKENADSRNSFILPGLGVINLIPDDLRHGGRFELVLHSHAPL